MIKQILISSFILLLFYGSSCNESKTKDEKKISAAEYEEKLIAVNKKLIREDDKEISAYIKTHNLKIQTLQTGLRYEISRKGTGPSVVPGDIVTISFKVSLLDGTECYNSEKIGNKTFKVGQGGVESGLEEGILLLNLNAKARFIMPPHLAHGLIGDQNKIPPRTIIIYEIEVLKIEKKK